MKENYYHIYNRGIDNRPIFFNEDNYHYFIRLMKENHKRYNISILVYCLIPNHFHILVQQKSEIDVSRFVQSLNNAFVQGMNRQLKRKGTLYEGRTQAKLVKDENYLMHACRYIHLNSIKHGLVQNHSDWAFSNYGTCVNGVDDEITDMNFIEELFSSREQYKEFVEDYIESMEETSAVKEFVLE
jgi:REP element-mobilizing transposase RayT|tara:strand:+ start:878 stop:1432 length:555 start_codon:yes stop_codon:yes gene_type:complete